LGVITEPFFVRKRGATWGRGTDLEEECGIGEGTSTDRSAHRPRKVGPVNSESEREATWKEALEGVF